MSQENTEECLHYAYCNDCSERLSGNLADENAAWKIANDHAEEKNNSTTVLDTCND